MRVTADDEVDVGRAWVEVEIGYRVEDIDEFAAELDGLSGRQGCTGPADVDIAPNSGNRSDVAEGVENRRIANVACMHDVIDTGEGVECLRAQQAMSV